MEDTSQKLIKPNNLLDKTTFIAKQSLLLAALSIAIAIVSVVWSLLNWQSLGHQTQLVSTATQNNAALNKEMAQQTQSIEKLHDTVIQLKNSQHMQLQKTLAEVSYLVHLSNLHLTIGHDQSTALRTLALAEEYLAPIHGAAFLSLKQALSADIAALKAAPVVEKQKWFIDIHQLNVEIQHLSTFPEMPKIDVSIAGNSREPWYIRLWDTLKSVKSFFVIRHLQHPNIPLISSESSFYLKQNIRSQLVMAQWALLHQNQAIYDTTLKTVQTWIQEYFTMNAQTQMVLDALSALQKKQIDPLLPTLTNTIAALNKIKVTSSAKQYPVQSEEKQPITTSPRMKTPKVPTDVEA